MGERIRYQEDTQQHMENFAHVVRQTIYTAAPDLADQADYFVKRNTVLKDRSKKGKKRRDQLAKLFGISGPALEWVTLQAEKNKIIIVESIKKQRGYSKKTFEALAALSITLRDQLNESYETDVFDAQVISIKSLAQRVVEKVGDDPLADSLHIDVTRGDSRKIANKPTSKPLRDRWLDKPLMK